MHSQDLQASKLDVVSRLVVATLREPGLHCWPAAFPAVGHLRHLHRHVFWFRVEVTVCHEERQVEFQVLQKAIAEALRRLYEPCPFGFMFGDRSCETIARELAEALSQYRVSAIEVWEDGENGCRVCFAQK